jgi:hypothetical protein
MGISFINSLMLAGLAAVVIPIIIHLLLKRKKKRLQFSTLQFFLKRDHQSSQRRRLRNWLLLTLRLLIIALLVLAFARPYLTRSGAAGADHPRQQAIFALDLSASMHSVGSDGSRWAQAKEQIQKALSTLRPDDRVALVGCSTHADVLSGFVPPASLAKTLADLQPAYGTSDLGDGLRQAAKLAAMGDPNAITTIRVVSDLQQSACQNLASCPLSQELGVEVLSVGEFASSNLAITQMLVAPSDGTRPQLVAASFSDEESPEVAVEVTVDGKAASTHSIGLKSGASTNVELVLPALKPGWHDVKGSLRTRDALDIDNARYSTTFVPEPSHLLVVESQKGKRIFEEDSFFIRTALDPTDHSTRAVQRAYEIVQAAPEELASTLSVNRGAARFDLVILPGLKQLPSGAGNVLGAFVQSGGGLLLFLGEEVSANRYNSELRELLPAQIGNAESEPDVLSGWRIGTFDTNSVVFAAFGRPNSGDLHIPEFTRRRLLTAAEPASVLAFFDDEVPLLISRSVGRGRVALVNTSANTRWNDWPKHKTFVPWLHGLANYLTQNATHVQPTNSFLAGEDFDIELGSAAARSVFTLRSPDGKDALVTADDQGRLRDLGTTLPGIYSLREKGGAETRRFAVNVPPQESDLATVTPDQFQHQIVRVQQARATTLGGMLLASTRNQKELFAVLLLALLGLLFIETVLANRTLA